MQSRAMSAVEVVSNVILGWLVAFGTQLALFPAVGMQVTLSQNIAISCAFTTVSLVRSYVLRRLFNLMERASHCPVTYGGEGR